MKKRVLVIPESGPRSVDLPRGQRGPGGVAGLDPQGNVHIADGGAADHAVGIGKVRGRTPDLVGQRGMGTSPKVARNREILAALAKGLTVRQVAEAHDISRERVHRILHDGCSGRTLALLPGTEKLSSTTRGLLIRLGYRSVDAILADLRRGKLYDGCAFGVGPGRFAEIEVWARDQDRVLAD
jgi:hypothetical protein